MAACPFDLCEHHAAAGSGDEHHQLQGCARDGENTFALFCASFDGEAQKWWCAQSLNNPSSTLSPVSFICLIIHHVLILSVHAPAACGSGGPKLDSQQRDGFVHLTEATVPTNRCTEARSTKLRDTTRSFPLTKIRTVPFCAGTPGLCSG